MSDPAQGKRQFITKPGCRSFYVKVEGGLVEIAITIGNDGRAEKVEFFACDENGNRLSESCDTFGKAKAEVAARAKAVEPDDVGPGDGPPF